jgi:hypothetical protein
MAEEMTAAEIGSIGERHATAALQAQGWSCYRNTQLPGSTDIEATTTDGRGTVIKRLLVQVKTAVTPNAPADLTADDKRAIISRANRNNAEAWLAQVKIDSSGGSLGIAWTRLS